MTSRTQPPPKESPRPPRRALILDAAVELLRRGGADALNMRALAEAAGVSIATPYNIFGSKEAVLLAVMEADLARQQARYDSRPRRSIGDLLAACTETIEQLTKDPEYNRALLTALAQTGNSDLRLLVNGPRYLIWKGLLRGAQDAGELRKDFDLDALTITVCQQLSAPVMEWVLEGLDAPELAARSRLGFALVLLGAATERSRTALETEYRKAQQQLQALWQRNLQRRLARGALSPDEIKLYEDQLAMRRELNPDPTEATS
jgi:AcrR family transcriptional regulator